MISRASLRARPVCFAGFEQSAWRLAATEAVQARYSAWRSAKSRSPMPRPHSSILDPSSEPAGYVVTLLGAMPASSVVGGQRIRIGGFTPLPDVVKMRRRILAVVAGMKYGDATVPPCSWAKLQ